MSWSHVQEDWSGFLTLMRQMLPVAELKETLNSVPDLDGFSAALALAADLTPTEARELILTRILPAWQVRQAALAAA